MTTARTAVREALRPAPMVTGFVADVFRSRDELLAENAMLRQQLIVAKRRVKQPAFRPLERCLIVALSSVVKRWQSAILLVKPDTVLRWHREGFRLLWKRKSKPTKQRQPRISAETIELIRDMAVRNKTWGAERIRGELLKLGIRVAKRTIQRHILAVRPPGDGQSWRTFLRNHVVWACDFVQVYDVWFRPVFAFFVIDVNAKEVIHVGVTRAPNAAWTAQQLRQLTPFGEGPEFIIRDNSAGGGLHQTQVGWSAPVKIRGPARERGAGLRGPTERVFEWSRPAAARRREGGLPRATHPAMAGRGPARGNPAIHLAGGRVCIRPSNQRCGEGGIRTHGGVTPTHDFQSCTFGRSVTSPGRLREPAGSWVLGGYVRTLVSLGPPRRVWDSNPRWSHPHT